MLLGFLLLQIQNHLIDYLVTRDDELLAFLYKRLDTVLN